MMKWLQVFWKSLRGETGTEREWRDGEERAIVGEGEEQSGSPRGMWSERPGSGSSGSGPEEARCWTPESKDEEAARAAVVQVGIDFGTSTTKIAYRQVRPRGGGVRPLIFDHGLAGVPDFGLPTLAMVDDDGRLHVGEQAASRMRDQPWEESMRAFKVLLGSSADSLFGTTELRQAFDHYAGQHPSAGRVLTPETVSFVFLAYVMREARRRISQLPEYRDTRLEFLYNVCLPMQHVESNSALDAFRRVLARAESLERDWPLDSGADWLAGNFGLYEGNGSPVPGRVFVVPESVAEAASYVASLRRSPGLHALIDIGAGTTDVSFFNFVEEPTGEHCYWYSSGNLPIGGLAIERVVGVNGAGGLTAGEISERINALRGGGQPELVERVRSVLLRIHAEARPVWSAAYKRLRTEGPWHRVEVFLSGGGAEVVGAKEIFASAYLHSSAYVS